MNTLIVLGGFLCVVVAGSGACGREFADCALQPTAPDAAQTGAAQPGKKRVVQGELKYLRLVTADPENLGRVEAMETRPRRVRFKNISEHELSLRTKSKSCACTTVSFEPEVVAPGAEVLITLLVTPSGTLGEQVQHVTFEVGDPTFAKVYEAGMVAVRYTPNIQVEVQPDAMWLRVPVAEAVRSRLLFSQDAPFSFDTTSLALDGVSGSFSGPLVLPAEARDRKYVRWVDASVKAGRVPGKQLGWLLGGAKQEERSPLSIPVHLETLPALQVSPPAAKFGREPGTAELVIRAVGSRTGIPRGLRYRVEPEGAPIEVSFTEKGVDRVVVVSLTEKAGAVGGCRISLYDEVEPENILAVVPVVWWRAQVKAGR